MREFHYKWSRGQAQHLQHDGSPTGKDASAKIKGLTLLELMIVLSIVAILSTIAYPSYTNYVQQSRRSDAYSALSNVALQQEKYRSNNPAYGTLGNLGLPSTSTDGHYTIAIPVSSISASGYIATATATGSQAGDTGCSVLTLTVAGNAQTYTPTGCMKK